jgi:hypothetical protein
LHYHFAVSGGNELAYENVRLNATPVPVPPAVLLLGSDLIGLIGIRRFRK